MNVRQRYSCMQYEKKLELSIHSLLVYFRDSSLCEVSGMLNKHKSS